jgi:hypothetical protein
MRAERSLRLVRFTASVGRGRFDLMRRRGNIKQLLQPFYNPCAFLTGLLG